MKKVQASLLFALQALCSVCPGCGILFENLRDVSVPDRVQKVQLGLQCHQAC